MADSIEAIAGSPPEKEKLVVQLFVRNGGQWAEIDQEAGPLEIEIYPDPKGKTLRFSLAELEQVIALAKTRLIGSE
jgi:hypothetical protein